MKLRFLLLLISFTATVASAQSVTEIYFPKYIQGVGNFTPAEDRKVPFACRMKVDGLVPNTTYRYYNRFVTDPTDGFSLGEGNYILPKDSGNFVRVTLPSVAFAGRYGEFTTNSAGSYTGWFITEPNSSNTFIPGITIYFRLIIDDGQAGGFEDQYLTAPSPVTVINFGGDSTGGTGLRVTPLSKASAKQFVFLYDNFEAQGRPIAGTFIESDGTDGTVANGYAPFYADSVNGVNKAFGTILPNNLPNGLQRMDLFGLTDGAFKRSYYPYPVIESWSPLTIGFRWPSTNNTLINTKNPNGGLQNILVIDGSKVLGINLWLSSEATTEEQIVLQWNTPAEEEAVEYSVERSVDGGKTFTAFNTVKKGSKKLVYELADARTEKAAWYRVVMIAKDGSRTMSEALKVQGVLKLTTYPNPVADQLVVKHPQAEKGTAVQVVGVDGRQLLMQNVKEGTFQTTVNVKNLVSGNYFLVFSNGSQRQSKLFVKQ